MPFFCEAARDRHCLRVSVSQEGGADGWGMARVWGSGQELAQGLGGWKPLEPVKGMWSEARVVGSLKPEWLASPRACVVAAVSPRVGLGGTKEAGPVPFGMQLP